MHVFPAVLSGSVCQGEACVAQVVCRKYSRLSVDVNVSVFVWTYFFNTVLVPSGLEVASFRGQNIGMGYPMCLGASLTLEIYV